jgi:ribonuclease R
MHSIMAEFGLPFEFPEEVEAESEAISTEIPQSEIAQRRDFRDVLTFTIDPVDAKDFDDALSIRQLENGNWEIGVHIADVTHYVDTNSALEREAFRRATSVYLVDRTIPMLPEKLSNGLCSLRPNEDKLTFSAVFEMDHNAKIKSEWFGRTVITRTDATPTKRCRTFSKRGRRLRRRTEAPQPVCLQAARGPLQEGRRQLRNRGGQIQA